MNTPRIFHSLQIFIFAFVVGTSEAGFLKPGSAPKKPGQEGIVILSVTQSPGKAATGFVDIKESWRERRLTTYIGEFISKRDFLNPPGALWVLELSAGSHRISRWGVMYNTGLGGGTFQPRDCPPLEFELHAGEILYLGNLHMETSMAKNIFGLKVLGRGYPTFRDERARDLARFRQQYPALAPHRVDVHLLDFSPWKEFNGADDTGVETKSAKPKE
jgi:hypothetical protein